MAEVFTISGAEDPYEMGAASAADIACAQQVKPVLIAGAVLGVGAVPVGLFGTYKLFKAHWAAGITALVGTGIMWFVGRGLVASSARTFANCSGRPLTPANPFPPGMPP